MDEEMKEKIRKANDSMGQKVNTGGYPGRMPGTLPEKPVFDEDPFGSKKTKPIDPRCYRDSLNPNVTQPGKKEDK